MALRTELSTFCCTQFFPSLHKTLCTHSLCHHCFLALKYSDKQRREYFKFDVLSVVWCRIQIGYVIHCQWASSSSHLQFLSDCYTLKTYTTQSIPALGITHPAGECQIMEHLTPQQYHCGNRTSCRTERVYKILPKTEHSHHVSKNNQSVRNLPLLLSPHAQGSCVSLTTIFARIRCLDRCPMQAVRSLHLPL